ncbi:hypothetical protein Pla175_18680 [Pirellulimonas nuda]|uniref:Uncharacterized protein n=1 Tax=Pirellulimonas nuda TaxID=2528009 RepID=A0A518DAI2_9BACT|nr:hypothetical protein [Pirellulimonas nuda]QDU88490.1 hypothetical protein Pla175_18680 [Pirellulimonas nuda]
MNGKLLLATLTACLAIGQAGAHAQDLAELLGGSVPCTQPDAAREAEPETAATTPAAEAPAQEPAAAAPTVVATMSVVPESCTVDIASFFTADNNADGAAPEAVAAAKTADSLTAALFTPVQALNINANPPKDLLTRMNDATGVFRIQNPAEARFGDFDAPLFDVAYQPARFVPTGFDWVAPSLYHWPLYFEQPNVERYGHYVAVRDGGNCLQSAACAAHFFATIPVLPYKLGADPCHERQYVLGCYRPGSCNPHRLIRPELSARGLLYQGIFTTGVVFITP